MKKINVSKVTSVNSTESRFCSDRANIDRNIWRQLDISVYEAWTDRMPKNLFNFHILERYKKETDKFQIVLHTASQTHEELPVSATDFFPINGNQEYKFLTPEEEIVLFEESRSIHLERLCRLPHLNEIWDIIDSLPWNEVILKKLLETFDFLDEKHALMVISQIKDAMGMFFKTNYHNNTDKRCVWEIIQYCGFEYANKYLRFMEKGE